MIGDKEVIERFQALPGRARDALRDSIGRMALRLQRSVKQNKLSGQALNVRTGRLRRSIDQVVVEQDGGIVGVVSTDVEYAHAHEYGFEGTVTVKAHLRRSREQMRKAIIGKSGFETKRSKKKWAGKGETLVRSHSRTMNISERSFLRSALHEMESEIRQDMRQSVSKAITK
ncbi:MAG: HK97 gp10 family phage protein [Betaproteobacteria bacterium]|nr:HK97 gp10 family phage protein [Betaproteobacteria bacterium]